MNKKVILTTLIVGTGLAALAQTNAAPLIQIAPSTAADIIKVLQDFGLNVTFAGISKAVGMAFVFARIFRNYAPASWQTSKIAEILSHIAMEAKNQGLLQAKLQAKAEQEPKG